MSLPDRPLRAGTLVFADPHVDLAGDEEPRAFLAWLEELHGVPEVLVLGDFFDFWVGPPQAGLAVARRVLAAVRELTRRGTRVVVVPGNRDFLLDDTFVEATGAELYPDGFTARAPDGRRWLFVHGDQLCTKDHGYQRLRRVLRAAPVRTLSRSLPLPVGLFVARRLRRASTRALAVKPDPEKAMQPEACVALAQAARAEVVVCGHAHRFKDETLAGGVRWIVLDAFGGPRSVLRVGLRGEIELSSSRAVDAISRSAP